MIDELIELTGFIEQFEQVFVSDLRKQLAHLESKSVFISKEEAIRRDKILRMIDFSQSFIISIKTAQEYAVVGRLLGVEFMEGVEKMKLLDASGSFRKSLLPQQVEFMNEFISKIKL